MFQTKLAPTTHAPVVITGSPTTHAPGKINVKFLQVHMMHVSLEYTQKNIVTQHPTSQSPVTVTPTSHAPVTVNPTTHAPGKFVH